MQIQNLDFSGPSALSFFPQWYCNGHIQVDSISFALCEGKQNSAIFARALLNVEVSAGANMKQGRLRSSIC